MNYKVSYHYIIIDSSRSFQATTSGDSLQISNSQSAWPQKIHPIPSHHSHDNIGLQAWCFCIPHLIFCICIVATSKREDGYGWVRCISPCIFIKRSAPSHHSHMQKPQKPLTPDIFATSWDLCAIFISYTWLSSAAQKPMPLRKQLGRSFSSNLLRYCRWPKQGGQHLALPCHSCMHKLSEHSIGGHDSHSLARPLENAASTNCYSANSRAIQCQAHASSFNLPLRGHVPRSFNTAASLQPALTKLNSATQHHNGINTWLRAQACRTIDGDTAHGQQLHSSHEGIQTVDNPMQP